tara:strand:- start:2854 stop:3765 length:912 start_codon:yes stop_codon:yes gene_type:complete
MNLEQQIEKIKSQILGKITFNESLSKFSWFNLGGPAKILFRPKNLKELSFFLKEVKEKKKIKVLGVGSNTLIRDGGYSGIIIKFDKSFSHLSLLKSDMIVAGASALDKNVSKFAQENSIAGFEFLSCIPGTIGGAVRMNSGCYGEDISSILVSIQAIDLNGNIKLIKSSEIKFHYRGSNINDDLIFISATFKGENQLKSRILKKMNNLIERKKKTQPSKIKTCGSTFKNPGKKKAWELIKKSGCAGMKIGGAKISKQHCNFFMNNGNAKSEELEKLIRNVQKKVYEKTGVNLELELQIIGENL